MHSVMKEISATKPKSAIPYASIMIQPIKGPDRSGREQDSKDEVPEWNLLCHEERNVL